ncbi:MAG: hypothetical protein H0W99_16845 [Acidobacteria bacterium]|nr:hypothetical protein [Acidobacteriota bacterium]
MRQTEASTREASAQVSIIPALRSVNTASQPFVATFFTPGFLSRSGFNLFALFDARAGEKLLDATA